MLHFTPKQVRDMTVREFGAGMEGVRKFNSAPDDAMTHEELDALCAEYPDEVRVDGNA